MRRTILGSTEGSTEDSTDGVTEPITWNAPSSVAAGDDRVTFRFSPKGGIQPIVNRRVGVRDDTAGFRFDDTSSPTECRELLARRVRV